MHVLNTFKVGLSQPVMSGRLGILNEFLTYAVFNLDEFIMT
jgi:hypothetical protein